MIESIGYTEDGVIWMKVLFEHEKQQGAMIVTLSPDRAKEISRILNEAAGEAEKRVMPNVRNSSNLN